MNWNKQYLTRIGCEAAYALLEENKESFLFAIEIGGIIDEVISLLNKLSIENINYQHLLPLFRITNFSNFEQRKILVEKGILKGLSKTFSSENDLVVSFSVFMASRILNGIGQLKGEGKQNPLFQELESDGTLTKLVEIFLTDKFDDIFVKVYSACSIGRIFKATQLPVEFGFQKPTHQFLQKNFFIR
ncbi:MAG: hypothetical protein EZS28_007913 [Streblomastix strix]|uniref:Uncharacterized protein n=1 Tax=Streblomastix strix TaxID=222440 RepID=A0A5J4WNR1_9EUKA|nr:MAG: hypothetical protein EZS28_007913 [Streblomastix strix]